MTLPFEANAHNVDAIYVEAEVARTARVSPFDCLLGPLTEIFNSVAKGDGAIVPDPFP